MPDQPQTDEPPGPADRASAVAAMTAATPARPPVRLGEIGLTGFAPYLMDRVVGRFTAVLRSRLGDPGMTVPKIRALTVLSVIEGPLIRDLAAYTVTEQSTLSRALDGLMADGLVRRSQDQQDSRGVRVCLTEQGRAVFEDLWPQMAEIYAALFAGIPEDERRALNATLQKLLANIDALPD